MNAEERTPANLDEPDGACESITEYKSVYQRARDCAREAGDLIAAERFQWDLEACGWSKQKTLDESKPHEYGTARFHPSHQIDDSPFPDGRLISAEQIDYWRSRSASTRNPILKARYHDLTWEFEPRIEGRRQDFQMALAAIDAYLDVARLLKPQGRSAILWIDALERAASLAISTNQKKILPMISDLTVTEFATPPNPDGPFIHVWPLKLLIALEKRVPGSLSVDKLAAVLERVQSLLMAACTWKHFGLEEACQEMAFSAKALQNGDIDVREKYRALGELAERQARLFFDAGSSGFSRGETSAAPAFLIAASHFETAQKHYSDAQDTEKVAEMKRMVRECYETAQTNGAYKPNSTSISFSAEETAMIRDLVATYARRDTIAECLAQIASDPQLMPDPSATRKIVEDEHSTPSLSTLLRKTSIRGDRKTGEAATDEERIAHDVDQHLLQNIQLTYQLILGPALHEIKQRPDFSADALVGFLNSLNFITEDDASMVAIGLSHYCKAEYSAAIHILVPRFESVLRNLLNRRNIDITKYSNGRYEDRTLSAILHAGMSALGEPLGHAIRLILSGEEGLNLRNRVAHGQLTVGEASEWTCDLVFFLFLALARVAV